MAAGWVCQGNGSERLLGGCLGRERFLRRWRDKIDGICNNTTIDLDAATTRRNNRERHNGDYDIWILGIVHAR